MVQVGLQGLEVPFHINSMIRPPPPGRSFGFGVLEPEKYVVEEGPSCRCWAIMLPTFGR